MNRIAKTVFASVMLTGAAMAVTSAASADVGIGFSFGYDGGYFSDPCEYYNYYDVAPPWGMPPDYCDYPVYFDPIYWGGYWYRGPIYYRWYGGERLFWLNGAWRRDEWRGARPSIRWTDRGGWRGGPAWGGRYGGGNYRGNNGPNRGWSGNSGGHWQGGSYQGGGYQGGGYQGGGSGNWSGGGHNWSGGGQGGGNGGNGGGSWSGGNSGGNGGGHGGGWSGGNGGGHGGGWGGGNGGGRGGDHGGGDHGGHH